MIDPFSSIKTMKVGRVERQSDRVVIHPEVTDRWKYHVVAPKDAEDIKIGDKIEYEAEGVNFGWFIRKIS